jgi:hypothetical protein
MSFLRRLTWLTNCLDEEFESSDRCHSLMLWAQSVQQQERSEIEYRLTWSRGT